MPPVISPVAVTLTVLMTTSISSVTSIGAVMVSVRTPDVLLIV